MVSAGHSILWPQRTTVAIRPTALLTGLKLGEEDRLVDDLMDLGTKIGECQFRQSRAVPSERPTGCVRSSHGSNCLGEWFR